MPDYEPIPNGHHRCPSVDGRFVPDPECGRGEYAVANTGPRPMPLALCGSIDNVIDLQSYREAGS